MEKLKMQTSNLADENFAALSQLFPNAVTETIIGYEKDEDGNDIITKPIIERAIDKDVLAQEINTHVVEGKEERYQFTWPDKRKSMLLANTPIAATLRPVRDDEPAIIKDKDGNIVTEYTRTGSVDFDATENIYIEGDNLDVLKLLRETYLNRIKMIYIDPPYNTGGDLIYDDDFSEDEDEFLMRDHQYDLHGNRLVMNIDSNGRFHTDWINMIYPRLRVARDLLKDDGVIFISIDEKEVNNLIKICDEVFGYRNRLETFHVQVRYANKSLNEDSDFQPVMEYVLIYAKNILTFRPSKPSEPYDLSKFTYSFEELSEGETLTIANKTVTIFKNGEWRITKHSEGKVGLLKETWASGSIVKQSGTAAEFLAKHLIDRKSIDGLSVLYKIHNMGEDGIGYRYVTGPIKADAIRGKFYTGVPLERLIEIEKGTAQKYRPIVNFYDYSGDFGNIRHEGSMAFNSGKKPIKMLENLLFIANLEKDDIVMDFFSGSASTAHAVIKYNIEYKKSIKFIMVQINEPLNEKDDMFREGYITIPEIGKERLRRAGRKMKEETGLFAQELDIGFRVLKLDSSNMKDVYYTPNQYAQMNFTLDGFADNIKPDRTHEDLLFQVMLEFGIPLSCKISKKGDTISVEYEGEPNYLVVCFAPVDTEKVTEIAKLNPYYAVFRDSSFANDSAMTNFEQVFNTYSPQTVRRVL